jgi:hypothetical protein
MEMMMLHPVTNWIGDAGTVVEIDTQLRSIFMHGEISETTGRVTGKRVEEGRHLVELDLVSRTIDGVTYGKGTVLAQLPSREGKDG